MLDMPPAALHDVREQLARAAHDHLDWLANLLRAIVCELPFDPRDLAPDAHRRCDFGRWYYEQAPAALWASAAFVAIGVAHERVHALAARILCQVTADRSIDRADFDELIAASGRLRREFDVLLRELQQAQRSRDPLTGVYHRDQVLPLLREHGVLARRGDRPCCIVLMDLDGLAAINDTHGHPTGDAVLAAAACRLSELLRPGDTVFRYGGDEFLIALPGTELATAQVVIAGAREGLARQPLQGAPGGFDGRVTASFGLAPLDPEVRVEDVIERAAQALLLAKVAGGNRAISWDASVTTGRHLRRLRVDTGEG